MKKSVLSVVCAFVAAATIASPAHAAEPTPVYAEARSFLASYGASESTQDRLIDELEAGGQWDSFSSENEPVKSVSRSAADGVRTINTYADGSISVIRLEAPLVGSKNASTQGVSGCSASGSVRSNCLIDMWVGLVKMSFRANYNLSTNKVTSVYGPSYSVGGSCSTSLISLARPASNIGRMDIQAQACVVGYSTTFFLQLKVSGGKTSVTWDG